MPGFEHILASNILILALIIFAKIIEGHFSITATFSGLRCLVKLVSCLLSILSFGVYFSYIVTSFF